MRYFRENWYLFIIIYGVFVFFDYWRDRTFNWGENLFQLSFFIFFYWLIMWWPKAKRRKEPNEERPRSD
jgi:hypothetical protein